MNLAIETQGLTKQYGNKTGCADISLCVPQGHIFGLLGPNGAGKSTLVKTLVGLLMPTSGQAYLLGQPLGNLEVRRKIGFLPENFSYHTWLTGRQLLAFHADLYGLTGDEKQHRMSQVLKLVGLEGREKQKVRTYSKGMRQRIGLACALLSNPKLLFLDEPTSALDPIGRKEVREIMMDLRREGTTIFLNSHLLGEVEMICDSAAFIRQGHIIHQGNLQELVSEDIQVGVRVGDLNPDLIDTLSTWVLSVQAEGEWLHITVRTEEDIPRIAEQIITGGGYLYELIRKRTTLEELFIRNTGGGDPS